MLTIAALPAMAENSVPQNSVRQSNTLPPLDLPTAAKPAAALAAPAAIASPDTSPLVEQLQALKAAQAAEPSTTDKVKSVMQRAFSLLGTPYRWGGTSPDTGFDCSGLVGYVFRTIGIDLPRVSREMAGSGTPVKDRDALAEGDLVFFGRSGTRIDHVGIYVGDGKFLHAPRTGRDVTVSSLTSGYWAQKYLQARRVSTGS
ncbi:C40 family peptidase [Thermomonas brevis]